MRGARLVGGGACGRAGFGPRAFFGLCRLAGFGLCRSRERACFSAAFLLAKVFVCGRGCRLAVSVPFSAKPPPAWAGRFRKLVTNRTLWHARSRFPVVCAPRIRRNPRSRESRGPPTRRIGRLECHRAQFVTNLRVAPRRAASGGAASTLVQQRATPFAVRKICPLATSSRTHREIWRRR